MAADPAGVRIDRLGVGDEDRVERAGHLFDDAPRPDATQRFLADPHHHLFIATVDDDPAGFVSGVELIHPDKGTEMFLYELGVDEAFRRRGIGTALVRELAELARARRCYGMWVLTDADNTAALATYRAAGATRAGGQVMLEWPFGG
jgi:ribosomal protein S18 acetylase RimI-like enzyme